MSSDLQERTEPQLERTEPDPAREAAMAILKGVAVIISLIWIVAFVGGSIAWRDDADAEKIWLVAVPAALAMGHIVGLLRRMRATFIFSSTVLGVIESLPLLFLLKVLLVDREIQIGVTGWAFAFVPLLARGPSVLQILRHSPDRRRLAIRSFPAALVSVVVLTGALTLYWYQTTPRYVDPFPQTSETAFAEAGFVTVATSEGIQYTPPGSAESVRSFVVRLDPPECADADTDCMIALLEAQPWVSSAFEPVAPPRPGWARIRFELVTEQTCVVDAGTSSDFDELESYSYREEPLKDLLASDQAGLWFMGMTCW